MQHHSEGRPGISSRRNNRNKQHAIDLDSESPFARDGSPCVLLVESAPAAAAPLRLIILPTLHVRCRTESSSVFLLQRLMNCIVKTNRGDTVTAMFRRRTRPRGIHRGLYLRFWLLAPTSRSLRLASEIYLKIRAQMDMETDGHAVGAIKRTTVSAARSTCRPTYRQPMPSTGAAGGGVGAIGRLVKRA